MKKTGSPPLPMAPAAVDPMLALGALNCGAFRLAGVAGQSRQVARKTLA